MWQGEQTLCVGDKMSKLIPFEVGMTLEAIDQEEQLVTLLAEDVAAQEFGIWRFSWRLTRNTGKHAGDIVIAPSKLTDFSPCSAMTMAGDWSLSLIKMMLKMRAS